MELFKYYSIIVTKNTTLQLLIGVLINGYRWSIHYALECKSVCSYINDEMIKHIKYDNNNKICNLWYDMIYESYSICWYDNRFLEYVSIYKDNKFYGSRFYWNTRGKFVRCTRGNY